MQIKFFEEHGDIRFEYKRNVLIFAGDDIKQQIIVSGYVPVDVVAKGKQSIVRWAKCEAEKLMKRQIARRRRMGKFASGANVSVSTLYGDVMLKGKIIFSDSCTLRVRLEIPFRDEDLISFKGFACAVLKRRIFDDDGFLTEEAKKAAEEKLVKMYKRRQQNLASKKARALVTELNKK